MKRNFVHVDDLGAAIMATLARPESEIVETFHIRMDEPDDFRAVADHLAASRGLPSVDIRTPSHST